MWSTIEQSIGIICACLITYRPIFSRLRSAYSRAIEHPATQAYVSKSVEMPNMRSKGLPRSSDAFTAGFARLYEEDKFERGVKTQVTVTETCELPPSLELIMKNQTIEQYHDRVSLV